MIFYDRETINHAIKLNNIEFEVINLNNISVVKSSEIFENYEQFLNLYSTFPTLPSAMSTNNPFMEQRFPHIIENVFFEIVNLCLKSTLPKMEVLQKRECRGNVGQYGKLSSYISSIFPHVDNYNNFQMVCNYWVNVNQGDGTQIWECDKIKNMNDLDEYKKNNFDTDKILNWFNIEENDDLRKKYFIEAKNNTCVFYFSNILHSPIINEDGNLRCSIVSWYDLGKKNES